MINLNNNIIQEMQYLNYISHKNYKLWFRFLEVQYSRELSRMLLKIRKWLYRCFFIKKKLDLLQVYNFFSNKSNNGN